ncbi:baseplate J/gp47 family protein [Paenibacillus turpanensis]|uniref:baseplate J/gp47 family protein n=1 Tax=Paenibacillus turpanensis TaxID=2689078 RepID=UPI0014075364|nr:baseplate J/gp47 family protein [Paenibacillus turpanensis]
MNPPNIDSRDLTDLIKQMKELAPYYTPEWRFTPDTPDPGSALFLLFADMFQENIARLNRVPAKNQIAFLNLLDLTLLPAQPASAYVTFRLNEGTPEPVLVPAGTQVIAAEDEGPVPFETVHTVLLTPASLTTGFVTSKSRDSIIQLNSALFKNRGHDQRAATPVFHYNEEENLQEHTLLLGHSYLLTLSDTARIEVELGHSADPQEAEELAKQLANPQITEWCYSAPLGWHSFDRVESNGRRVILYKHHAGEIIESMINGIVNRWIQCKIKRRQPEYFITQGISLPLWERGFAIDFVEMKTDYNDPFSRGGLRPDLMFHNDLHVDAEGFYPFGDYFALYGMFYISCQEAFSKKDARIQLEFTLSAVGNRFQPEAEQAVEWKLIMKKSQFQKAEPPLVTITQVIWEYWNGSAWIRLHTEPGAELLFTEMLEGSPGNRVLTFHCPQDMEPVFVNGIRSLWIRSRIIKLDNAYAPNSMYLSPWISGVSVSYQYGQRAFPAESCVTINNLHMSDCSMNIRKGKPFVPFVPLDCPQPALYLAFDQPPLKGPISIYVSAPRYQEEALHPAFVEWEYMRSDLSQGGRPEWSKLKLYDGTAGLHQSGLLTFAGPADFRKAQHFGVEGYWIRAVNRDKTYDNVQSKAPLVNGFYLNTVQVVQQESIENENPELRGNRSPYSYQLARNHIVSEEVWVNETELSEEEAARMEHEGFPPVQITRDSEGNRLRAWVRWSPVRNLADSESGDRHYVIDRTAGQLRFGDGRNGMSLPKQGSEQVRVSYKVTMGDKGNVGAGKITRLQNSIAFVGSVINGEAASGGSNHETFESAIQRGPHRLKHSNRAVTAEDFEWLAREADPSVAKVKCLPNVNARMEREIGCLTLVVLPKNGQPGTAAFMKRLEEFVIERASGLVASTEYIRVVEPVLLEISVTALIVVQDLESVLPTEQMAVERLSRFLHPTTGYFDGNGWSIGQHIHASIFYGLLKSIPSIQYIEQVYMTVYKWEKGRRQELDGNRLSSVPHGIVISGVHNISAQTVPAE